MRFQSILPVKLAQAAITTSAVAVYTVPDEARTFLKGVDICNTTAAAITFNLFLVASGGSASTSNALAYGVSIPANSMFQWTGIQVMNEGEALQAQASAVGLTINASGGEAV